MEDAAVSVKNGFSDDASAAYGNVFRRSGRHWDITFEGRTVRVRDVKGLGYVAELLRNPGEPLHVATLLGVRAIRPARSRPSTKPEEEPGAVDPEVRERMRKAVTNRVRDAIARIRREHDTLGEHLARGIRTGSLCSYAPGRTVEWTF